MTARIAAVGAGRMGRGIALAFAYAGHEIALVDFRPRSRGDFARLASDAQDEMESSLQTLAELEAMPAEAVPTILQRIRLVAEQQAADVIGAAEIIFEGVPETLEAKRDAFARAASSRSSTGCGRSFAMPSTVASSRAH